MKRYILGAALLASLAGFTQAHAEPLKVGFSLDTKESSLQTAWETFLRSEGEAQGKAEGYEVEWTINVANADPARQAANIDDLITAGVDVIIARAFDSGAIGTSIKAANDAGIPFITFDRGSTSGKPTAHVGGDSYDQARSTGVAFAEILKKAGIKGKCIELQGMLTDINAVNRSKAWNDVAKESGQYETIVQVPTEWNPELFLSGLTNALTAKPEANCVFAASDFAFPSIQAALEKADRWAPTGQPKHIWLATADLLSAAVTPMEHGYIDVSTTWDAYLQAKEAVRVIIALKKGEDPKCGPDGCLAKGRTITPATIKETENLWSRDFK
ncbi:sugar ABC transporter substrate-binding protein [Rhizobium leguminosarum]|uniref:sugar ABC transporter substrate-binding protein n=1 Tax=Rhizobium leguminosarum TaxID=384 RepID=UPI001C8FF9FB|nr:sugar ABC transporter substrate-binding protein [Rhizobium leguminosarum]MBY2919729.1 sugar ABC transporter substrate-binding protein [Rhizobium leguminosarum]MBY2975423.1 sugar ABC transporter substrate-binding protein [Rhizobium leguminosarum]MBY2977665.1 sugar ABC transporter substrate-binding protein [Rhizobium leguminosarum]MBY3006215.1 sugar ABC transporter substrate-binding protein [Rhizobium leguminosarum]